MATAWLRGVVKEVPSGDTVVVAGTSKTGPPPEKRLTLSSLIAPKLGKRDGSSKDEAFAWEAREYLRKLAVGQPCVFKVDFVVEQINNREFGSVFLNDKENLALAVVSNGWAKVRQPLNSAAAQGKPDKNVSPYMEDLIKAEEAAKLKGSGIWSKDPERIGRAVRDCIPEDGYSATTFFQEQGKGKQLKAVLEGVLNGSTLRVIFLPEQRYATVVLAGVQCPSMGRRSAAVEPAAAAASNGNGAPTAHEAGSNGSAAAPSPMTTAALVAAGGSGPVAGPEPYAREAKALTEAMALNREVSVVLEGMDKYGNLFATVTTTSAAGVTESIAEALVTAGLAKGVEWSLNMMLSGALKLRELERSAKAEKKGVWTNYVPAPSAQAKASDAFSGRVMEVVSGDTIVVRDNATRLERRIQLSSIRAPRPPTRERAADPWSSDAKDFLRKRLVGREVDVKLEYTRKVGAATSAEAAAQDGERLLVFGNVEVPGEKGEERANVAEMVVARGFATVIRHRSDEERSGVYERLMEVEEMAKGAKRGLHSGKEPAANRINDISQPGSANRAKQFVPFFQRAGKMAGLVENVLSGHRLRVTLPKEAATIVFAPSAIKTPSRPQPAGNGRPAVKAEPYAEEALAFTRELVMQRDVEVTVETMDRGGTFLGALTVTPPGGKPINLGLALLRAGLARVQDNVDLSRLAGGAELKAAETTAKEARLKIWETWTPEVEQAEDAEETSDEAAAASSSSGGEMVEVVVTEVAGPREVYCQLVSEPRVAWIAEQLAAADVASIPPNPELRAGQLCLAQYTLDNAWYRAYIERVNRSDADMEVFFIDYGNREKLPSSRIRPIDAPLAAVPPQAHPCQLAYVKIPEPPAEYAGECLAFMRNMLGGGAPLLARVLSKSRPGAPPGVKDVRHPRYTQPTLTVDLLDPESSASVIVELLQGGFAHLPKLRKVPVPLREAITALQVHEEEARKNHRGMFQYGDPGDSDDEEQKAPAATKKNAWGR